MEIFRKRPTALLCFAFILTSVVLVTADVNVKNLFTAAVLAAVTLFFAASLIFADKLKRYRAAAVCLGAAAVAAVLLSHAAIDEKRNAAVSVNGAETLSGTVTEIFYDKVYGSACAVRVKAHGVTFKALLETEFSSGLAVGDVAEFTAVTVPIDGAVDARDAEYYLSRGIVAYSSVAESGLLTVIGREKGIASFVAALRARLSARLFVLAEAAGGDGGMMAALLTGDRAALSPTLLRDFRYIGAIHLLAVSGLHLSVLTGGLEAVLKRLPIGKNLRVSLLILAVIFYMGLTGFSSSAVRAGIMLVIYYLSFFFGREPDSVTSLFLSVALMIAVSPYAAADTGLLLSFSAMLACIYAGHVTEGARAARWGRLLSSAVTSLCALLFTLPVMWMRMGSISWLSPLSTLVFSLPVTLVLYLSPFALLFYRLVPLSELFAFPAAFICRITALGAELLSRVEGAVVRLPAESIAAYIAAVLLTAALCAILACRPKTSKAVASSLTALVILFGIGATAYANTADTADISYFRRGKNEVLLLRSGADTVLFDVTDGSSGSVYGALDEGGPFVCRRIGAYVITHLHSRHVRTVAKLCGSAYVERIFVPKPETEAEAQSFDAVSASAERYGVAVQVYERSDGVALFGGTFRCETASIGRSSHPVIAIFAENSNESVLYLSSSVHESEIFGFGKDCVGKADRIIFGIHGPVLKSGADYGIPKDTPVFYGSGEVYGVLSPENSGTEYEIYEEK